MSAPGADDLDLDLAPADEAAVEPDDDLAAAAASALEDPAAPEVEEVIEPFGYTWKFDYDAGRFVRQGSAPARVSDFDALREWCMVALNSARFAHTIFSEGFGVTRPQGPIGAAGDVAEDLADDWREEAREALLVHDRVAEVELEVEYDPVTGDVIVSDLTVTTDEEVEVNFDDLRITPTLEG